MKAKNIELKEIIDKLNKLSISHGYSDIVLDAIDKLYLAIFEDEKSGNVFRVTQELKKDYDNSTQIAEECAEYFNVNFEGGPLDQEDHWIWELAAK